MHSPSDIHACSWSLPPGMAIDPSSADHNFSFTDFQKRPEPYNGEIRLCPPDSTLNNPTNTNITSVSFGVVALYMTFGNKGYWRGIVQLSGGSSGLSSSNEANAICRQLGFTDAIVGSAIARSATNYRDEFTTNC